jgi:hypothetical protein
MRTIALAGIVLLAACQPAAQTSVKVDAKVTPAGSIAVCGAPATREVAFSAPDAKDVLAAQGIGGDCMQATILLTLRTARGELLWAHATPVMDTWAMAPNPDGKAPQPSEGVANEVQKVIKDAEIGKSSDAPDWPEGKDRPQDPTGLFITTDLIREMYLEARAAGTPMICLYQKIGHSVCVAKVDTYANELFDRAS